MTTWPISSALIPLRRASLLGLAMWALAPSLSAADESSGVAVAPPAADIDLPLPDELRPQVDFWKRVYSEITTQQGFVHDSRRMLVYETVAIPQHLGRRGTQRFVKTRVSKIATALETLAHGKRDNLNSEETQVLSLWPVDVDDATLMQAAENVRFQTGQKEKFAAGLLRSRTWMPYIERTFAHYGLPKELAALPHVESSFNIHAYSKARAAGIWQFLPTTARRFMHLDSVVDERYDPIRSTEAAARLLKENFRTVGSWPLAITAYNHGAEGMRRAVLATGSADIAAIVANYRTRRFGFASRNFYTELLAAWDVSQHAEQYFGVLDPHTLTEFDTVTTDSYYRASVVAQAMGVDLKVLRAHNPALRPAVWNNSRMIPAGFALRVPHDPTSDINSATLAARLASIPAAERFAVAAVTRPLRSTRRNRAVAHNTAAESRLKASLSVVPAAWAGINNTGAGAALPWTAPLMSRVPRNFTILGN